MGAEKITKAVKVSVIMYVLNGIPYIEKAVRSVMDQTLKEIEIIVVDGGSTDGTLELIEELAAADARIRLLHTTPGVGRQFNTGLKAASGEYIGICEGDDYLLPDMYEKQYALAKKEKLDVLKGDKIRFCEAGGKEWRFRDFIPEGNRVSQTVLHPKTDNYFLEAGPLGIWSGIYRREFLVKNHVWMNETRGAVYQDTSFAFLSAIKAERAMVMEDAFYCYRVDNPNSSSNDLRHLTMMIDEYNLLKKRLKEEGLFERYQEFYLMWKLDACMWFFHFLAEEKKEAFIQVLYQDLHQELLCEHFTRAQITTKKKNAILLAAEGSKDEFRRHMEDDQAGFCRLEQALRDIDSQRVVIVFGAGNMGRMVCQYLARTGRKKGYYTDNDKRLWGKKIEGIPVIQPEKAVSCFPEGFYLIANIAYGEAIHRQLLQMKIQEEQIAVCDDYDVFFKKFLVRAVMEGLA